MNYFIQKIKNYFIAYVLIGLWRFFYGIKVKVATSSEELEKIFHLRWKLYSEYGYIEPQDFPDQKLTDIYDQHSFNVIAYKNNTPIGTARLVMPSKNGFPTEKAFNIINLNVSREKIGEVSKLCIEQNNDRRKFFLALMTEIYKLSKKNKIDYWLVGIPFSLKEYIKKFNFPLSFIELKIGPLKPENIEERKSAKKYFEKYQISPFLIDISKL